MRAWIGILLITALLVGMPAQALTINASLLGGASLLSGSATSAARGQAALVGVELTVDVGPYAQVGAFYDHNVLEYQDGSHGSLKFYGAVVRANPMGRGSSLYVDAQIGANQRIGGPFDSGTGAGFGAGVGYDLWVLPYLDLSPRLGVRLLPEPYQGTTSTSIPLDFGLLLTFGF
jgi:hypothetical protein